MVKEIKAEMGEECKVDVNILHETLLKLPAEKYIDLYHKMQAKILGEPYFACNCGTPITENETA